MPKKKSKSPTARTLEELRKRGYTAGVVERYCSFSKKRHDLFGFIDIIAVDEMYSEIIGFQVTSGAGGNMAAHRAKILAEPRAYAWLAAGGLIYLWGWVKRPANSVRPRPEWCLREEEIKLVDFQ